MPMGEPIPDELSAGTGARQEYPAPLAGQRAEGRTAAETARVADSFGVTSPWSTGGLPRSERS